MQAPIVNLPRCRAQATYAMRNQTQCMGKPILKAMAFKKNNQFITNSFLCHRSLTDRRLNLWHRNQKMAKVVG